MWAKRTLIPFSLTGSLAPPFGISLDHEIENRYELTPRLFITVSPANNRRTVAGSGQPCARSNGTDGRDVGERASVTGQRRTSDVFLVETDVVACLADRGAIDDGAWLVTEDVPEGSKAGEPIQPTSEVDGRLPVGRAHQFDFPRPPSVGALSIWRRKPRVSVGTGND